MLVPALPGYDFENDSDFSSVEQIALELNGWIKANGYTEIYAVYGCSMGGSISLMVTLGQMIKIKHCIMDGGITKEDLQYVADVLRHCSRKTIWRTFDSCNNYKVPESVPKLSTQIHYWYAEGEEKERKLDINYMKRKFPQTKFEVLPKLGHAGLVLLKPELFAEMIDKLG